MPAPLANHQQSPCSVLVTPVRAVVSHDTIRHVHERAPHPTLRPRALQEIFGVKSNIRARDRNARSLNVGQQWQPLRIAVPPSAICPSLADHVVLLFDPCGVYVAIGVASSGSVLFYLESDAVGRPRCAVRSGLRKGRLTARQPRRGRGGTFVDNNVAVDVRRAFGEERSGFLVVRGALFAFADISGVLLGHGIMALA